MVFFFGSFHMFRLRNMEEDNRNKLLNGAPFLVSFESKWVEFELEGNYFYYDHFYFYSEIMEMGKHGMASSNKVTTLILLLQPTGSAYVYLLSALFLLFSFTYKKFLSDCIYSLHSHFYM